MQTCADCHQTKPLNAFLPISCYFGPLEIGGRICGKPAALPPETGATESYGRHAGYYPPVFVFLRSVNRTRRRAERDAQRRQRGRA
jgi:hypothetical protein